MDPAAGGGGGGGDDDPEVHSGLTQSWLGESPPLGETLFVSVTIGRRRRGRAPNLPAEPSEGGGSGTKSDVSRNEVQIPRPLPNSALISGHRVSGGRFYSPSRRAHHLTPAPEFLSHAEIDTSQITEVILECRVKFTYNPRFDHEKESVRLRRLGSSSEYNYMLLRCCGSTGMYSLGTSSQPLSIAYETSQDETGHQLSPLLQPVSLSEQYDKLSPPTHLLTSGNASGRVDLNGYLMQIQDTVKQMLSMGDDISTSLASCLLNSDRDDAYAAWPEIISHTVDSKLNELSLCQSDDGPLSEIEDIKTYLSDELSSIIEENVKSCFSKLIPSLEDTIISAIGPSVDAAFKHVDIGEVLEEAYLKKVDDLAETSCERIREFLEESFRQCIESPMKDFATALDQQCMKVGSVLEKSVTGHFQKWSKQPYSLPPALAELEDLVKLFPVHLANMRTALHEFLAKAEEKLCSLFGNTTELEGSCNGHVAGTQLKQALNELIKGKRYQEAFSTALAEGGPSIVHWLCHECDLDSLFSWPVLPVSQGVALSLLLWLSSDLATDTTQKLSWMVTVACVIDPTDDAISPHLVADIDRILVTLVGQPVVCEHRKNRRSLSHILQNLRRLCEAHELSKRYREAEM